MHSSCAPRARFHSCLSPSSRRPRPTIRRSTKSWSRPSCAIATLRDLPASATVLDAHTLEVAGVQHFQDVLGLVPNLNWSAGTSRPRYLPAARHRRASSNGRARRILRWVSSSTASISPASACRRRCPTSNASKCCADRRARPMAPMRSPASSPSTRARRDASTSSNANVTFGDYGTRGANGVLGGPIGDGEAAWRLVAGNYRSDGFRRDTYPAIATTPTATTKATRASSCTRSRSRTCAPTSPRCGPISTMATTRSPSTTRAPRCPTSPGRTRSSRARSRCASTTTAPELSTSSAAAPFGNVAQRLFVRRRLGQRRRAGARTRPTTTSSASTATARTLSEDLRLVSRASVAMAARLRVARGRLCAAHRRRRAAARRLARPGLRRRRSTLFAATIAPPISPATASSNGASGDATVLAVGARGERRGADYQRYRRRGLLARTKPCSADR